MAGVKVGWVGAGKLGLPCALVLAQHHEVYAYDRSDRARKITFGQENQPDEAGIGKLLDDMDHRLVWLDSPAEVVREVDVVFVAVPTPHSPEYGGEAPMPEERSDFDYAQLVQACRDICAAARAFSHEVTLVVVSTVLPGTTNRLIRPLLNPWVRLVYSPQFIAMGTTIADFQNPEFVICGCEDEGWFRVRDIFWPVHGNASKLLVTSIENAEAIKVFYNTFVSMKIVWANMVMETCHKTGADCDEVVNALSLATDRVVSSKYMRGGMGDGGACHPRDLIAMSWLAQRLELSYDLLGELAFARECQTEWLAGLARKYHELLKAPVLILGKSYKPGSALTDGSPALLLRHYLADLYPYQWDPHADISAPADLKALLPDGPLVYVIATAHPEFAEFTFTRRSVVIDPFGYIPDQEGVTVVRVGRK